MNKDNPLKEGVETFIRENEKGRTSRQWIAIGLVMTDHLLRKCPLTRSDYVTREGGEIRNSRSGLREILGKFDVPPAFLKEVTSRSNLKFGDRFAQLIDFGKCLQGLSAKKRQAHILDAGAEFSKRANDWLLREKLKLSIRIGISPQAWVSDLMKQAESRSGGKVEQHLVGAKLACRHPNAAIPNLPSHAADRQTRRSGDIEVGKTVYHVTAAPRLDVVKKCIHNSDDGLHPVLLVPRLELARAYQLALDQDASERITIMAIEDFVATNVIELSNNDADAFADVFRRIIKCYNERLQVAESDPSLMIDLESGGI